MKLYEAMFVVNHNAAKEDYEKVEAEALGCITRHGGEIVNSTRWDDRRLAYEIDKHKRGTYILVHFNAEGEAIARIEKQCRLSEVILRVLIIVDEDGPEPKTAPSGRDETPVRRRDKRRERGGSRSSGRQERREEKKEEKPQPAAGAAGESTTPAGETSESGEAGESK